MRKLEAFEGGTGIILYYKLFHSLDELRGWYRNFKERVFFLLCDSACSILTTVASKKKTYFSHCIFRFHQMNWVSLALFLFTKIHKTRHLNLTQIQLCWFKITLKQRSDLSKPFNCSWPHYFLPPLPPPLTGCHIVSLGIDKYTRAGKYKDCSFDPLSYSLI